MHITQGVTVVSGQPLTIFGNKACARFSLLVIVCIALSIYWAVAWQQIRISRIRIALTKQQFAVLPRDLGSG